MPETVGGGGSVLSTLAAIFRNEGYAGLYAGLRPTLVTSVPNTVLYFTAYDEISARLRRRDQDTTNANNIMGGGAAAELLAGSSARLLASLATAPLELIRTRQASFVASNNTNSRPPGMMEEFRVLTRTNGLSSLYVGVAPTLWRDVPFSAIYWLFLERFRSALSESRGLGVWGGSATKQCPPRWRQCTHLSAGRPPSPRECEKRTDGFTFSFTNMIET